MASAGIWELSKRSQQPASTREPFNTLNIMVKQGSKNAAKRIGKNGKAAAPKRKRTSKWSASVTQNSDALSLEPDVFKQSSPRRIALSLKRSADSSKRRKATPFQSAMSMLNFYINRAGRGLSADQKVVLQRAKGELREVFGREQTRSSQARK